MERWYEEFLEIQKAEECVYAFDSALPDYASIHPIKKVDTILWSIR